MRVFKMDSNLHKKSCVAALVKRMSTIHACYCSKKLLLLEESNKI